MHQKAVPVRGHDGHAVRRCGSQTQSPATACQLFTVNFFTGRSRQRVANPSTHVQTLSVSCRRLSSRAKEFLDIRETPVGESHWLRVADGHIPALPRPAVRSCFPPAPSCRLAVSKAPHRSLHHTVSGPSPLIVPRLRPVRSNSTDPLCR